MSTNDTNLPPLRRPQVPRIDADIALADERRLVDWCEKTARSYARAATAQLRQQLADDWEWADANLVRAEAISDAQWEVENLISETFRGYTLREAIDHARRIEGDSY